jgi:chromosome segregation ATPase
LERRARKRYNTLDRLDADLSWYRGQYNALVEALRSLDRWLVYRAEALLDHPPEQDAQGAGDVSAVERVRTALAEWDDALHRARKDLAGARTIAAAWEAEVLFARAQLQQDGAALEVARAWQSQAEEKAKEAKGLRTTLADKAAALATTEEQLRQEQAAFQQAETQLQQECAALAEDRATLEQERLAREEALGRLQQERTALEGAQAALKQREDEASKLNGELVQLSISHEDLRQSLEEQETTVRDLRREAKEARKALEVEKKQVEGELVSVRFFACRFAFWGFAPIFLFLVRGFQACRLPWGTRPPRPRRCRRSTTPLNKSWRVCRLPPSRSAKRLRRAWRRPGACWRVACAPSGGMFLSACAGPFT